LANINLTAGFNAVGTVVAGFNNIISVSVFLQCRCFSNDYAITGVNNYAGCVIPITAMLVWHADNAMVAVSSASVAAVMLITVGFGCMLLYVVWRNWHVFTTNGCGMQKNTLITAVAADNGCGF
jgi:hypothetical protein